VQADPPDMAWFLKKYRKEKAGGGLPAGPVDVKKNKKEEGMIAASLKRLRYAALGMKGEKGNGEKYAPENEENIQCDAGPADRGHACLDRRRGNGGRTG